MSPELDAAVVGGVYSDHREAIERAIARSCGAERLSVDEAMDFAQDVRLRFIQSGDRIVGGFRGHSTIDTYLFAIVRNQCQKWCAARRRRSRRHLNDVPDIAIGPHVSRLDDTDSARITKDVLDELDAIRMRLTAADEYLLTLRFEEGRHWRDIAMTLGLTPRAAWNRLSRLLARLKKYFWKTASTDRGRLRPAIFSADTAHRPPARPPARQDAR